MTVNPGESLRAEGPCCVLDQYSPRRDRRIRILATHNNNIRVEVTHPPRQRENVAHDAGGDRDDAEHEKDERGTVCAVDGGRGGAGS